MKFDKTNIILIVIIVVLVGVIFYLCYNKNKNPNSGTPPPNQQQQQVRPPQQENQLPQATLALFYSHSCGHCTNFMPTWNTLKQKLQGKIGFFELEGAHPDMPKFGIQGFPTVRLYGGRVDPQGRFAKYEGNRTEQDILGFLQHHLSPPQQQPPPPQAQPQ